MNNKRTETARIILKVLMAISAAFAIVGSIGFLITRAKVTAYAELLMVGDSYYSDGVTKILSEGYNILNSALNLVRFYDFSRFGIAAVFGFAVVLAALDKASGGKESVISKVTLAASIVGFICMLLTSFGVSVAVSGSVTINNMTNPAAVKSISSVIDVMWIVTMIIIALCSIMPMLSLIVTLKRPKGIAPVQPAYYQQGYPESYVPLDNQYNAGAVTEMRRRLGGGAAASAVFALLGAVFIFVIKGLTIAGVIDLKPTNIAEADTVFWASAIFASWDMVRLGGFSMLVYAVSALVAELCGRVSGKGYTAPMAAAGAFGMVSAVMLSVECLFRNILSAAVSSIMSQAGSSTFYIDLPCIFAIAAAVVMFIALGVKSAAAGKACLKFPLAPQQQYPQQTYPQQSYPQQTYPQYPENPTMPSITPVSTGGVNLNKSDDSNNRINQ